MSTPYATFYTRMKLTGIPQPVAEKAAATLTILDESRRFDTVQLTDVFINSYRNNPNTALDALDELLERVEMSVAK
jgi:hypothetical protein